MEIIGVFSNPILDKNILDRNFMISRGIQDSIIDFILKIVV
jgi:hypothetical protein